MRKYSRPQVSCVHSLVVTAWVSVPFARCSWLKTSNAPSLKEKGVRQLRTGYREINKETIQDGNGYKHRSWTPAPFTGYQPYALHWAYGGPTVTFNLFDIPVFLPYYKSLVLEQTEADWQQEDVAEEPVEQQRHKLLSFGANAAPAQAINDTPGSQESGGGGTMSYRAAGSIASTSSFTVVNQADVVRGGSARRATSARSPRAARSRIAEDGGGRSPSGTATREDEAGKATTSSKRKPSTSATRNESEARLRRQLQHNTEKLERSERARTELENRLSPLSGCSCTSWSDD